MVRPLSPPRSQTQKILTIVAPSSLFLADVGEVASVAIVVVPLIAASWPDTGAILVTAPIVGFSRSPIVVIELLRRKNRNITG